MKTIKLGLVFAALLIVLSGCTKKDNLTGNNWSDIDAQFFTDTLALSSGYSFPADSLVSIKSGRKNLLVGNWQGASAQSLIRFTGLPADSVLTGYHSLQDASLDLILMRRNPQPERTELNLKLYQVKRSFTDPDSLSSADYTHIADAAIASSIATGDTLSIALPRSLLNSWQSNADSTGLNILIRLEEGSEGFVELKLSTANEGSKLRYKYQALATDELKDFASYASKEAYSFSHPGAELQPATWKLSNFNPQRMYVDIQPEYAYFKDADGNTLSAEDLKRVNINKAELVLYIKTDQPNFKNAYSYFVSAFLVKEKPESPEVIPSTGMESVIFAYPLVSSTNNLSDSLIVNITPIIQAYSSGKKEPKGIVIMSNFERKDFGEIEFYHPNSAPDAKAPYIRVKYTPPFL